MILGLVVFSSLSMNLAFCEQYYDDYSAPEGTYYQTGLNYLQNSQYTSAILEFKKALRENPSDISSKIGITNAYVSRAAYFNNKTQEYSKAANDLRSAIFYMKYYDDMANDYIDIAPRKPFHAKRFRHEQKIYPIRHPTKD